jgi:hypothetical protein
MFSLAGSSEKGGATEMIYECGSVISRRAVLLGAAATAAVASVAECPAAEDPIDAVEKSARLVADCMQALHGGSWNINISHGLGMVSISKQVT